MKVSQNLVASERFDSDRPIECRQDDRLGRRSFADTVARQISAVPANHGFTFAVVGEWGSGKTSVLNMVAEALANAEDAVTVLRFNPWLFGSTTDLVTLFFRELSAQLRMGRGDKLKDVAKALLELGESFAPLSPFPGANLVVKLFSVLTGRWTQQPSLLKRRDQLKEALRASGVRVVVLIDDIDRLEARETLDLMRLVRLTSDLPNVVFGLAFDRGHVARSLRSDEIEGRRYLEKIVQISYDLPTVRDANLQEAFSDGLEELLRGRELAQPDADVWPHVFYDVIKPLLVNLRDIKRFLYSIPVTLDTVGEEVALADLLCLEAVRILRPAIFDKLRANAEYLVHSEMRPSLWMTSEERKNQTDEVLKTMLESEEKSRRILTSVLKILFPATPGFLDNRANSLDWTPQWRKQKRVASEEIFRTYLQAGLDEGRISSREIQELAESMIDERKFAGLLDALCGQHLESALWRLEEFENEFPQEAVPVAVPVLVKRMERLLGHSPGMFGISPRFKVVRVVLRLLRRIENPDELMDCMSLMFGKVDSLSGWFELVELVGHRENIGNGLVSQDQAKSLEDQLVDRLMTSTAGQLANEWNLASISVRTVVWLEDDEKEGLVTRLRENLSEDGFVLNLLRTAVSYAHSSDGSEKRLWWDELVKVYGEEFAIAVDRLAGSAMRQGLPEDEQDTVNLAQKYASGWRPEL